ncbi:hypothetical protein [Xanthomonas arboricola]|uniref:hypothetical protein n=1 Tax=Xanthomonas arboricola TaxID=56448 RepID=UPI0011AECD53|nr:hypothetical protein [Xanthomonas arboricola]
MIEAGAIPELAACRKPRPSRQHNPTDELIQDAARSARRMRSDNETGHDNGVHRHASATSARHPDAPYARTPRAGDIHRGAAFQLVSVAPASVRHHQAHAVRHV